MKILAGPLWDGRFSEFFKTFTNRQKEFEVALAIHTAVGVDELKIAIKTVDGRIAELNRKYAP